MKFIFVCGGVLSGLGKGIVTSSIGLLLKSLGFDVTAIKIDPYFSMDAGTMRPAEHGEISIFEWLSLGSQQESGGGFYGKG